MQRVLDNSTSEIDISTLPYGIYIVQITGTNWVLQKRMIRN